MYPGDLIPVFAVVLHNEGRAYTCKNDDALTGLTGQVAAPGLLLIYMRHLVDQLTTTQCQKCSA